jgi:hypothetical protein
MSSRPAASFATRRGNPGPAACERVSAPTLIRSARWTGLQGWRPRAKLTGANRAEQNAIDGLKDVCGTPCS